MESKIQIRDFDYQYQDAAAELVNVGLGEHFGFIDVSMNPDLYDIETNYQEGDFILALDGGRLVGTGSLMPESQSVGRISRMHISSEYRRHGIATRILEVLEQRASGRGLNSLVLETNLDWDDAIAFYSKNGYAELGRNTVGIRFGKSMKPTDR